MYTPMRSLAGFINCHPIKPFLKQVNRQLLSLWMMACCCVCALHHKASMAAEPSYPSKPVHLVVPFAPAGGVDTAARMIGQRLSELWSQSVLIDNRAGANSVIGTDFVAKSTPDGHTLLVVFGPPFNTVQLFSKNVPYQVLTDFTPVSIVATVPMVVVVPPNIGVNTASDLIEFAKQRSGQVSFGTSGAGSSQQLGGILLGIAGGVELTHIPYKGGSAALNDVLGGHIPVGILALSNVIPYVKTGKLKAIGVIESHRSTAEPLIPTIAEAGVPGFAVPDTWVGFLAPAGLPKSILDKLSLDIAKAVESAEVRQKLEGAGFEVGVKGPEIFKDLLGKSIALYKKTTTDAGIKPE
jgi:tripartite-type tricarboxylate transporter receptor subunit TctC